METRQQISNARIQKEFAALEKFSKNSGSEIKIIFDHNNEYVKIILDLEGNYQCKVAPEYIIYPSNKFPFEAPYVYCTSHFVFPTINDGRTLYTDIVGHEWDVKSTFISIVCLLPSFTKKIIQQTAIAPQKLKVGELPHTFDCSEYFENPNFSIFQFINKSEDRLNSNLRFVLLSDTICILCEIVLNGIKKKNNRTANVLYWFHIMDINSITNENNSVELSIFDSTTSSTKQLKLEFSEENKFSNAFVTVLKWKIKVLNSVTDSNIEMSKTKIDAADFVTIDKEISELESDVRMENIDNLLVLYRKKIELLSTVGNEKEIQVVLGKLHSLLEKPNVTQELDKRILNHSSSSGFM